MTCLRGGEHNATVRWGASVCVSACVCIHACTDLIFQGISYSAGGLIPGVRPRCLGRNNQLEKDNT